MEILGSDLIGNDMYQQSLSRLAQNPLTQGITPNVCRMFKSCVETYLPPGPPGFLVQEPLLDDFKALKELGESLSSINPVPRLMRRIAANGNCQKQQPSRNQVMQDLLCRFQVAGRIFGRTVPA